MTNNCFIYLFSWLFDANQKLLLQKLIVIEHVAQGIGLGFVLIKD